MLSSYKLNYGKRILMCSEWMEKMTRYSIFKWKTAYSLHGFPQIVEEGINNRYMLKSDTDMNADSTTWKKQISLQE